MSRNDRFLHAMRPVMACIVLVALALPFVACRSADPAPQPGAPAAEAAVVSGVELYLTKIHCYDVNDGGLNGRTDETFLRKDKGGSVWQKIDVGRFNNGTSRNFGRKLLYPPGGTSFWLMEEDNGPDDRIGEFAFDPVSRRILPGRNTTLRQVPPGSPPGSWWLLMTGSGARYEVRLLIRATAEGE